MYQKVGQSSPGVKVAEGSAGPGFFASGCACCTGALVWACVTGAFLRLAGVTTQDTSVVSGSVGGRSQCREPKVAYRAFQSPGCAFVGSFAIFPVQWWMTPGFSTWTQLHTMSSPMAAVVSASRMSA